MADDDYTSSPDERETPDPVAQATAAAILSDKMQQEEAGLLRPPMWTPMPAPQGNRQTVSMVSPPNAPNLTKPFTDSMGRVHYDEMAQALQQVNRAMMARQQFEAQQGLRDDLNAGMPYNEAWTKWGPGILGKPPTKTITAPRWVPADPSSGAPGHFETAGGAIHVPSAPKPPPMNTIREVIPEKPGVPGKAAIPAKPSTWFGLSPAHPAIPAVPDIPTIPQRTITYRVPATQEAAAEPLQGPKPPEAAINHLIKHPELAKQFDDKYGKGWAKSILGQ